MKRHAAEHPDAPPSRTMRCLHEVPSGVLAELPDRANINQIIQRERSRRMPRNPRVLEELLDTPDHFRRTKVGEQFLIYDSFEDNYENDDRIIVFSTRENIRILAQSRTWFVDGTFKVVPTIFYQHFVIMGSVQQVINGKEQNIALPLVYALLKNKTRESYDKVFQVTISTAQNFGIHITPPQTIISDFELAIINAATHLFGPIIRGCLFHLCQNIYRHIQSEGLQRQYNDEEDRSIKVASQMLAALAFVPPDDVPEAFDTLANEVPDDFTALAQYFDVTYVHGITARGRRRAVAPRYPPSMWNQYGAVLQRQARTNNMSEGWHNRFQILLGNYRPSLYTFLTALQNEQGDVETIVRQINLGQKTKKLPLQHRQIADQRIFNIVSSYNTYVENDNVVDYLKAVGYNLHL